MSFQQSRKIKRESSEGYISDKSSSNEAVDQVSSEANERAGRLDVVRRAGEVNVLDRRLRRLIFI